MRDDLVEANRAAWNETAPIHAAQRMEQLLAGFKTPGFSVLKPREQDRLVNEVGLKGKDVAQLACNNGRELLSIKNLGAGRCVGFDISDEFIAQGRELAKAGGIDCEFVRCAAQETPAQFDGSFDLVYISIGALGWMPDVGDFFAVVGSLLRPRGQVFIYEMHPILDCLEVGEGKDPLKFYNSYFKAEPFVDNDGLDYYGKTDYEARPTYWFHHKMSDIIGAALSAGMTLEAFDEYPDDISSVFAHLQNQEARPPLSYILIARKQP